VDGLLCLLGPVHLSNNLEPLKPPLLMQICQLFIVIKLDPPIIYHLFTFSRHEDPQSQSKQVQKQTKNILSAIIRGYTNISSSPPTITFVRIHVFQTIQFSAHLRLVRPSRVEYKPSLFLNGACILKTVSSSSFEKVLRIQELKAPSRNKWLNL